MSERYVRQLSLLGEDSPSLLAEKRVMVCGLGGVGGYILEALVRSGVGKLVLVDMDVFSESNLNRQLLCTTNNIGRLKTEAAKERVKQINPGVLCEIEPLFLTPTNIPNLIDKYKPDYIADAIDNISAKVALASFADKNGISIISSMGTGNKLDPTAFECVDIYKTSVCPLAKVMRRLLKEKGVQKLKVVYSKELPKSKGEVVSSVSFVPATAGLIIAGEIIKDLCGIQT